MTARRSPLWRTVIRNGRRAAIARSSAWAEKRSCPILTMEAPGARPAWNAGPFHATSCTVPSDDTDKPIEWRRSTTPLRYSIERQKGVGSATKASR
ncbi:hypothetical protein [Sphingomonas adhaesiva]|uniref:hypothetical protein n=1 Tax=Sphingomonas adhaesiva TaxID=28212 RepID=UPI002FFBF09A